MVFYACVAVSARVVARGIGRSSQLVGVVGGPATQQDPSPRTRKDPVPCQSPQWKTLSFYSFTMFYSNTLSNTFNMFSRISGVCEAYSEALWS
jgi:hypothetical protein